MAYISRENIAIVGGGIAGLFCAYILSINNRSVQLFEASGRFGGRIRTIRLKADNSEAHDPWDPDELEFCAEFGPMRLELDKQLLVRALLEHLRIPRQKMAEPRDGENRQLLGAAAAYLIDFPSYASPTAASDPKYELRRDEEGKSPLQLLRLALLRAVAHLEVPTECGIHNHLERLRNDIQLATATQEAVEPIFVDWLQRLTPTHCWEIQTEASVGSTPLYALGFWNLLSDYLSHDAIIKLRDLGTFYHLLPENPNAAEWLVWWLIGFGTTEHLHGIFGGMQCIVDKLCKELEVFELPRGTSLAMQRNAKVTSIRKKEEKFQLLFDGEAEPRAELYDRVILALPKSPLERIVHASSDAFKPEKEILSLLDSAFSFPMVKLFVAVKNRWWEQANRANRFATKVPTRELHYWKGNTQGSMQGLIMLYTDRPASSFWANYLPPEEQLDVDWSRNPPPVAPEINQQEQSDIPEALRKRLLKKAVQYVNENNLPDITEKDIAWFGIRDWGREPYGGANHAWRPERRYWIVMRRLADIAEKTGGPSIHICGEAYSDYHGFIEGSLRSAVYVSHRILKSEVDAENLQWLERADIKTGDYLGALQRWAHKLDDIPGIPDSEGAHLWNPRSKRSPRAGTPPVQVLNPPG
jgi:monoamine oxidase